MSVDFNASFSGSAETFGAKMTETPASMTASMKETGGGSASNYEALRNKPKINGHELIGDMTPAQLGITDDRHHTHKQAQAAKVWTVAHNLGKLWLIIDSTPDPGIPIGNQSSQLLALLYLDAFDHWLRDDRGLVYGRYMDDFYIIHSDKLLLRQILKEIEAYIKPLGLRLNGKTQILPLKNGIDFLGFHTYLTQTGKVVRKVRAKSIDNMKRKIRKFRGLVDSGKMTLDSVVQSYASWTGHISHGNTYHLRQNMDAYFFSYFPELKPSPKGDTTHGPKTEQPRKQVEGQVRQPVRQPDRLDRGR